MPVSLPAPVRILSPTIATMPPANFRQLMRIMGATPHDRLSQLIDVILQEVKTSSPGNSKLESLVGEAKRLVDGYDDYAIKMSSPTPEVVEKLLKMTNETNWEQLQKDGKTLYELVPEMSAGGYEGVVLAQFAKITKV